MYSFRSIYFDDPPVPDRALDIFPVENPAQGPGLFFVHGGGWGAGTRGVYREALLHKLRGAVGITAIQAPPSVPAPLDFYWLTRYFCRRSTFSFRKTARASA